MYPEQTDTMEVVPEVYEQIEGAKQQTRRHLHLLALGKQQIQQDSIFRGIAYALHVPLKLFTRF